MDLVLWLFATQPTYATSHPDSSIAKVLCLKSAVKFTHRRREMVTPGQPLYATTMHKRYEDCHTKCISIVSIVLKWVGISMSEKQALNCQKVPSNLPAAAGNQLLCCNTPVPALCTRASQFLSPSGDLGIGLV